MFAAAATGYTYRRRAINARSAVPEMAPPDIACIVGLAKTIDEHFMQERCLELNLSSDKEGTLRIVLKVTDWHDDGYGS